MPLRSSLLPCSALALAIVATGAPASAARPGTAAGAPRAAPAAAPARSTPAPATTAPVAPAAPPTPPASTTAPGPVHSGPRVAVDAFKVEGDDVPPALVLQLLDGFVLGLVRQGLQVVDPDDVKRRLAPAPELAGCDTSPCLKRKGQLLQAPFVARVKVDVTGNSYKMLVRVYRTEGAAPAALPVDTRSRFCDVCTIAEAREVMIKLADGIDLPRDEVVAKAPAAPPPPPQRSRLASAITIGASVAAIVAGALVLSSSSRDDKTVHALAGMLMGAGAFGTTLGVYLLFDHGVASTPRGTTAGVALGATF